MTKAFLVFVLTIIVPLVSTLPSQAEDFGPVREAAIRAFQQVQNYAAVKLKVKYEGYAAKKTATIQILGENVWYEGEGVVGADPKEQQSQLENQRKMRLATGCELPQIISFDGKKLYEFNPFKLETTIKYAKGIIVDPAFPSVLPKNWCSFQKPSFITVLEGKYTDHEEVSVDSNGVWTVRQDVLSKEPRAGMRHRYLVIDPRVGYLVTDYGFSGGLDGTRIGKCDWTKQDGKWYVKHGKITWKEATPPLLCEWTTEEISFDAEQIRSNFAITAKDMPFGTHVISYEGGVGSKVGKEEYVGGKDGEEEYRMRRLAIAKARQSD